jgi:murein DD-endopeptidase MepM/ murein hydrolase activator NlpD
MEENGSLSYWSVLFKASSFAELLDRIQMIMEIAEADQRRMAELADAAQQVEQAKTALETEKAALEASREALAAAQTELEAKRLEADQILQDLLAREAEFEQLLEDSEQRQEELMQELAEKEDEYDRAKYEEWLAAHPPAPPAPNVPAPEIPKDESDWITPVPYYTLTSPFGMRLHPILGIWRMHNGVDLACAEGTPIYASRGGLVEVAAYQADGAGNYIQINHGDGFRSIYMHMTHYIVQQGQYVAPGQIIGYVGNTGLSKGAHLHFGISYQGTYVNPMEYIG